MSIKFKLAALMLLLSPLAFVQNGFATSNLSNVKTEKVDDVIIWLDTVAGYVNWTPSQGNYNYTVTIMNMTTGTLHSQVTTPNTYAPVSGLVNGNTYKIAVTKGSQSSFIIIDIIDIG